MVTRAKKSMDNKGLDVDARVRFLRAFLAEAAYDGWSMTSWHKAIIASELPEGKINLLFPGGIPDVVAAFGTWIDDAMLTQILRDGRFHNRRTRDKIAFAVMARLEAATEHREAYRRLLAWYAIPTNIPKAVKRLYQTVDLAWREAGDAATDFNFYTKRGLLAGVVKSTTFYWLTDDSPSLQATRAFLERRISEILRVGKAISLAKEWSPQEWLAMARDRLKRAVG